MPLRDASAMDRECAIQVHFSSPNDREIRSEFVCSYWLVRYYSQNGEVGGTNHEYRTVCQFRRLVAWVSTRSGTLASYLRTRSSRPATARHYGHILRPNPHLVV